MNILLVANSYPPEIRSISLMMKELAEDLVSRGHRVTVVTFWPRYNLADDTDKSRFREYSTKNGVDIIQVKWIPLYKMNFIIRGISELTSPILFWRQIKKYVKHTIDAVIVYISPLPLAWLGCKVKKKYGARFLLNIQDIFPQNAIDLGIMRNPLLIRFFEYLEKKAYGSADVLTSHTDSSRKFLIEKKGSPPGKIHLVHNWIDIDAYVNTHKTNIFRKKYGLEDRFVFLFAGIIGPAQGLDLIVNVATKLREIPDICFLFVGDGTEKEALCKMVVDYKLDNILFKPFVSLGDYPQLVKDADVGLVCLSSKNKTSVVPGKIMGFMAASLPVLAFLNKECDGHALIRESGCGYSMASDAPPELIKRLIIRMYTEKDKLVRLGKNGFDYAMNHFTKKGCIDRMMALIDQSW